MHFIRSIFVVFFPFMIISCDKEFNNDYKIEKIYLPEDVNILEYRNIPVSANKLMTEKYWKLSDNMEYVMTLNNRKKGNFIDIILPSDSVVSEMFPYGDGPNEFLYFQCRYDGDYLYAMDYILSKFSILEMDSLGENKNIICHYVPREFNITSIPFRFNNQIYLLNPYYYVNETYGINQKTDRFLPLSDEYAVEKNNSKNLKITFNVGQSIPINMEDELWLLSMERSIIEIFDTSLNKIKEIDIESPVLKDADVIIDNISIGETVNYHGHYPASFYDYTKNPDNGDLYMLFKGKIIEKGESEEESGSFILLFNKEGEFLKPLYSDKHIRNISIKDDALYGTILDEDNNPQLVKFYTDEY